MSDPVRSLIEQWRQKAKDDMRGGAAEALRSHREYFGRVNAAFAYAECADELSAALAAVPQDRCVE